MKRMKGLFKIYVKGCLLLVKVLGTLLYGLLAAWIILLPVQLIDWLIENGVLPVGFSYVILALLIVYVPIATYFAFQVLGDINKENHHFRPLIDRLRGKDN